jgi:hypothetical protein
MDALAVSALTEKDETTEAQRRIRENLSMASFISLVVFDGVGLQCGKRPGVAIGGECNEWFLKLADVVRGAKAVTIF